MDAGCDQAQRGVVRAVDVGGGVGLGARIEENLRDFDRLGGGFLAIIFDAVGGDVMQQGGAVSPSRAGPNQVGVSAQKMLEGGDVAGDNGVGGGFEILCR